MSSLLIIVSILLLIISIIDWKFRSIPSVLLTGILFVVATVSVLTNPMALSFGILGFIMAYLLFEADFFGGVADIKVMTIISFMLVDIYSLFGFMLLVGIFGITWKGIIKLRIRKEREFAFLPVFFFVYVTLWILGGLA